MDTIEYLHQLIAAVYKQTDDAMEGLTVEQFNWPPPGTASPISAIFIHLLTSEDFFIQAVMQGRPQLWDQGGWAEKTGIRNTPGYGGNWEEFKHITLAMEPALAYQQAMRAATGSYLEKLTAEEFEGKVKMADWEGTVADVFTLLARHSLSHAGEIAILKGIQGGRGLPY